MALECEGWANFMLGNKTICCRIYSALQSNLAKTVGGEEQYRPVGLTNISLFHEERSGQTDRTGC